MALGVGPGDEVVVPESTWIATAAPIDYVGATPIFADVEPDTWCASLESVRSVLTPRTKAILLVDLYGGFPDLLAFEALAAEHGIALIEDAAEAAGGWHAGRAAGSFGRVSTFSFHGSKTLTTGEGGMVLSDDSDLHERMLLPARPRAAARRRLVPQRRGRMEVQDERAAGRPRTSAARPHRGADREEATDLRLVPGPTRRPRRSSSTSSAPASAQRSGW